MMKNVSFRRRVLRRPLCALLLLSLLFSLSGGLVPAGAVSPAWTGGTASGFAGGAGTEGDPYRIGTGEQLAYFAQTVNAGASYAGKYILLTQDILLNSMNADGTFVSGSPRAFTRIGSGASAGFLGTFDGGGYTVIGLYINQSGTTYQGLFGYAGTGSVIRNLGLSGSVGGSTYSGAVAGYTDGLVENCVSSCTVTVTWQDYHGGVAGYAGVGSTISGCTVSGPVTGTNYVGGVAGRTDGEVTGCMVSVTASVQWGNYHGGVAGYAGVGSAISDCAVSGSLTGNEYVGGVAGYTTGSVTGCTGTDAAISGQSRAGGLVGYAAGVASLIDGCAFSGTVEGRGGFYVGGLAGQADGTVSGCAVTATVTGTNSYIGGVVGYAAGTGSVVTGCTVAVTVSESSGGGYAGGVAGMAEGAIADCTVTVSVSAPNSYIGGVAGYAAGSGSSISGCTVSGTVYATAGEGYVGGVAGKVDGAIAGCATSASVSGVHHYVGGVVGYAATGSEVSHSSSTGAVSGNSEVGGIAGYTDGTISICINTGAVTGNNGHTGGVAGMAGDNSTVSNSFNAGAIEGGGQGGVGGIVGYVSDETVVHHNLNNGTVDGSQTVGSVTGNAPQDGNAWNNYYYDYEASPPGANGGDIEDLDAAMPVGEMTWEEICALLNTDEDEEEDVWAPDLGDDGIPKPELSPPAVEVSGAAIRAGRYYLAASLGEGTAAAVTADSVFTVAYSVHYGAACALETQTVGLAGGGGAVTLPAGASVIMLADGVYYYVNLAADLSGGIPLGDFVRMGSETETYPAAQVPADSQREYLFIFDFSRTAGIAAGSHEVRLCDAGGIGTGTAPVVTVAGKCAYTLLAEGGANAFSAAVSVASAAGYDAKTDGAALAFSFSLSRDGAVIPWPDRTRISGVPVASGALYAFAAASSEAAAFTLDFRDCADPPEEGSYTVLIDVYACPDPSLPRGGFPLASGQAGIVIAPPADYGIRVEAGVRVFDRSASEIPVPFQILTLGAGSVKATLQYKYGAAYINLAGQTDLPVAVAGGGATLFIPAGSAAGTYRFVFVRYDEEGIPRAETVKTILVK